MQNPPTFIGNYAIRAKVYKHETNRPKPLAAHQNHYSAQFGSYPIILRVLCVCWGVCVLEMRHGPKNFDRRHY